MNSSKSISPLSVHKNCKIAIFQGFPPAFNVIWGKNMPQICTIKDPANNLWEVKLVSTGKDLYISEGWKEFVTYHKLLDGDFLVFRYDGVSLLEVLIFGRNGILKDAIGSNNHTENISKETTPCREELASPVGASSNDVLTRPLSKEPSLNRTFGGCYFLRSGKMVRHSLDGSRKVYEEKYFRTRITDSCKRCLRLSKKWLAINKVIFLDKIRLMNSERKVWCALVKRNNRGIYVGDGWSQFLKANDAMEGDLIMVELIRAKGRYTKSLRVLIDRRSGSSPKVPLVV